MTCEIHRKIREEDMLPVDRIASETNRKTSYRNMAIQAFDVRFRVNMRDMEQLLPLDVDRETLYQRAVAETMGEEIFEGIDIKKEVQAGHPYAQHYSDITLRALGVNPNDDSVQH